MSEQLLLPLKMKSSETSVPLIEGECNHEALYWMKHTAQWPVPRVVWICGPSGCGKTYLGTLWAQRYQGVVSWASDLTLDEVLSHRIPYRMVRFNDDARLDETLLFHLYNQTAQIQGNLLMVATRPPQEMGFKLPDLMSRLYSRPIIAMHAPDETDLNRFMTVYMGHHHMIWRPEHWKTVMVYLPRSFKQARLFADTLIHKVHQKQRPMTSALVRQVLDEYVSVDDAQAA